MQIVLCLIPCLWLGQPLSPGNPESPNNAAPAVDGDVSVDQKLERLHALLEFRSPGTAEFEQVLRDAVDGIRKDERASELHKRQVNGILVDYLIDGLVQGRAGFEDKMRAEAEALAAMDPKGKPTAVAAYHVLRLDQRDAKGRFLPGSIDATLAFHERFPEEIDIFARLLTEILQVADSHDDASTALAAVQTLRKNLPEHKWTKSAERLTARLDAIGKVFPLEGRLLDGSPLDPELLKGKIVAVFFWSSTDGPSRRDANLLRRLYEELHDSGLEIVAVSLDTDRGSLETYVEEYQIPGYHIFPEGFEQSPRENPLLNQYAIDLLPTTFLLDREGKLVSTSQRDLSLMLKIRELVHPGAAPSTAPVSPVDAAP